MASNANQATLEQEVQALRSYAAEYSQQFELLSQQLRFIETARAESLASIEALEAVTVEKSTEEAISFLRDRITEMDASGKRLSESLGKLQSQMAAVEQRMQEIYASAQQQNR